MAIQALTLQQQRAHKANLLRNVKHAKWHCHEHHHLLLKTFGPLLALKLPRAPKPIKTRFTNSTPGKWNYWWIETNGKP